MWVISEWLNFFVNLNLDVRIFPPYKCLLKTSIRFFYHIQIRLSSPCSSVFFLYYFPPFSLCHHLLHFISLFQHFTTYPHPYLSHNSPQIIRCPQLNTRLLLTLESSHNSLFLILYDFICWGCCVVPYQSASLMTVPSIILQQPPV